MEEINKNKTHNLFQIILPMLISFIIISLCGFLLFRGVHNNALNLRILGDISTAFLLVIFIPSGILSLASIIALIYLISKSFIWFRTIFQNIQSLSARMVPGITKICGISTYPFIYIESFCKIFEKNKNPEG